jgi:glutamine amidotransferase
VISESTKDRSATTEVKTPAAFALIPGATPITKSEDKALREAREELGIALASPVNLFITDGTQLAAVRYTFDFGCYPQDPAELVPGHFNYYSLWVTLGRNYGLHNGEWKMAGGSEDADSVLVASEPLTRDVSAWVEVPEYTMLHAALRRNGQPAITLRALN